MPKLIEDYSHKDIDETALILVRIKKDFATQGMGFNGNTHVTWTGTTAIDCIASGTTWKIAQDRAVGGNEMDTLDAEDKMILFHGKLKGVAKQANLYAPNNEVALVSTGLTMAKVGEEVGEMDVPVINGITDVVGIPGSADINIVTSEKTCYGTHIEVKNVATGVVVYSHSKKKHIVRVSGFVHGVDYMVRVAYDGTDETKVWSDWKPYLGN